jgi:glycolate oxidase
VSSLKINHDIVVPKARIPELLDLVARIKREFGLKMSAFGHVGDGNIHVNMLVTAEDAAEMARAHEAEGVLFRGVIALEGAITGEHGVGFSKAAYLDLALDAPTIALLRRVKQAFDPHGVLNPGKIFPDEVAAAGAPGFWR